MEDLLAWLLAAWVSVPLPAREIVTNAALTFAAAVMGRLLWHVRKVQHRERRFFSVHLALELVTAVCVGWVADGIAAWLELTGKPAIAFIIVVSYLGPGGLERLFWFLTERYAPARKG